jgi:hypothetical protein
MLLLQTPLMFPNNLLHMGQIQLVFMFRKPWKIPFAKYTKLILNAVLLLLQVGSIQNSKYPKGPRVSKVRRI